MDNMSNNICISNSFGKVLNNIKTSRSNKNTNTNLQNVTNGQDTVEIGGETKTEKKKNKKFLLKLIAIGAIITGGAFAIMQTKRGKLNTDDLDIFGTGRLKRQANQTFEENFCHEKLFEQMPTNEDLDKFVDDKIKNVVLDYGFGEDIQTADKIKSALESTFGLYGKDLSSISQQAEKDETLRQLLRILSGNNFASTLSSSKEPLSRYYADNILSNYKNNQGSKDELEKFMKFLIKKTENSSLQDYTFVNVMSNYKGPYKNATRLMALVDNLNDKFKLENYSALNAIEILEKNPNARFSDISKIMGELEIGSLRYLDFNNAPISLNDIQNLFNDRDLNLKQFAKIYGELNEKVFRKINASDLQSILTSPDIDASKVTAKLNALPEGVLKEFGDGDATTYLRFEKFIGKSNINELTQAEKRELMNKLIRNNSYSFGNSNTLFPLIPKNQEEYCSLLNKLAKSIGIDTKPLSQKELKAFESGLLKLERSIGNVDINNLELSLTMSKQSFIEKATKEMAGLSEGEQRKVMDYFGFEITDGKLKGYPINANNGVKLAEIKDTKTKQVIENLRQIVIDFSENNPVKTNLANKAFEQDLNEILRGLPELRPMIGKAQHHTHAYTLDKHTLKVLQGVVNNPKFKDLPEDDKKILTIASLLHDITKAEGLRDFTHPMESAFDAYYIIQKMNLPEEQQLKIYELIKSHNWLDRLNNPKNTADDIQRIAQDIAFDSRHTNTFELAKILCEADMKAVKKDASFFDYHKKTLEEMSAIVDKYVKRIHETQIVLPQTVIPRASQIKNGVVKQADGIKNTVIYMDDIADDLTKYGFAPGTTKDNWRGLVHALEYEEQMQKFNTFNIIDTEALLSTSYIDTKGYKVFRKQGFILDVNPNDIHAGYCSDFGTGYSKSIELLKSDYLFSGLRQSKDLEKNAWRSDRSKYRDYISSLIKRKMNVNDEEYIGLIEKIQGCKSLTDIEKVDNSFAKALKEVFEEMESKKRKGGRQYNEMLVSRPKIQGVFAYDKTYEAIPEFLRKYAQDNDLPIIIFGKGK